jgi:hypothetical protein
MKLIYSLLLISLADLGSSEEQQWHQETAPDREDSVSPPPFEGGQRWTVGQAVWTTSGTVTGHPASKRPGVSEYLGIPFAKVVPKHKAQCQVLTILHSLQLGT